MREAFHRDHIAVADALLDRGRQTQQARGV